MSSELRDRLREMRGPLANLTDDLDAWGADLTRALRAHEGEEPDAELLAAKSEFFKMQSSLYMVHTHRAALLDRLKKKG